MLNPERFAWWSRECGAVAGTMKFIRSGGEVNDPRERASGGPHLSLTVPSKEQDLLGSQHKYQLIVVPTPRDRR
jgi:hypothetical protein